MEHSVQRRDGGVERAAAQRSGAVEKRARSKFTSRRNIRGEEFRRYRSCKRATLPALGGARKAAGMLGDRWPLS
ncbi:MAG: hypothetical protein DME92_08885 [Verrucomicrobia bacterium]|nr:MAG: hypothetical protein DME92_08885 [Verrucomicrobiota bacterium]